MIGFISKMSMDYDKHSFMVMKLGHLSVTLSEVIHLSVKLGSVTNRCVTDAP
jgi:hypothetical protein